MSTVMRRLCAGFMVLALLGAAGTVQAQQKAPKRSITKIAGDLYRFQNNFHFSVFLVTDAGVIVTDPINADAAKYLKAEIKKRFNKPIKYLIYSHDHRDHIAGGEVFDGATVIAHENARAAIIGEKRPTAVPDITFKDQMTVDLGGKKVELTYVGPSHSDNMIVMNFPAARTLYVVDIAGVKRVLFKNLADSYHPGWASALRKVEGLDYDRVAFGHGAMGTKADITANRQYLEALYGPIMAGVRAGKSLDELKASVKADAFKDWGMYKQWLPLNIEGIYNRFALQRRGN